MPLLPDTPDEGEAVAMAPCRLLTEPLALAPTAATLVSGGVVSDYSRAPCNRSVDIAGNLDARVFRVVLVK